MSDRFWKGINMRTFFNRQEHIKKMPRRMIMLLLMVLGIFLGFCLLLTKCVGVYFYV